MSENLLDEYKAYYAIKAEKYADNPNYKNSYAAEKKLSDAMQSCGQLEEFKDKMGNLNELCAVALIKDEAIIENTFFEKHQEHIRKLQSERILGKVDTFNNVLDLATMVSEESNKNSIEISMDEANRQLVSDWRFVDLVEVYTKAEVPEKYKQDMLKSAQDYRNILIETVADLEENNDAWQAGWRLNPDSCMEYRHKRLMPYKEEHIQEQLSKYKSIIKR